MTDGSLPPPPPPPPTGGPTPPPGYVAYGGVGHLAPGVQGIGSIAKALGILMTIQVPLQVFSLFLTWQLSQKANDLLAGAISEDEFKDATRSPLTTITGLLFFPIAVLTMIWMYRMASNLKAMYRPELRWAPMWGVVGWFLPPCGVYALPWLMFLELWKGSDPDVAPTDPAWKRSTVSPLVHVWWVLYGLLPIIGLATSLNVVRQFQQLDDFTTYAEQLDKYSALNLALGVASIGAAAVYLVIVRQLSARHMRFIREL